MFLTQVAYYPILIISKSNHLLFRYQVWQTGPLTQEALQALRPQFDEAKYDVWDPPKVGGNMRILVAPDHVHELFYLLDGQGLTPRLLVEDVQT
jgi:hypothetical protein